MLDSQVVTFLGVAVLVTVMPGADMALLAKHALMSGQRAAYAAMFGIMTGLGVWVALSAAGLAALLNTSATAFAALKILGGAYLVYLGLQSIWQSRGGAAAASARQPAVPGVPLTGRRAYRQGLLSNLLNPKVGIFYTSFLPQFVAADDPALMKSTFLGIVHILIGLVWLVWYIKAVSKVANVLGRPPVRRWFDRATGAILVAFGLRLAVEHR